jgi:hypothetical protein
MNAGDGLIVRLFERKNTMPQNNTAKNTYIPGRDSTSGRNAERHPELDRLDRAWENRKDKGTNDSKKKG